MWSSCAEESPAELHAIKPKLKKLLFQLRSGLTLCRGSLVSVPSPSLLDMGGGDYGDHYHQWPTQCDTSCHPETHDFLHCHRSWSLYSTIYISVHGSFIPCHILYQFLYIEGNISVHPAYVFYKPYVRVLCAFIIHYKQLH